MAVVDHGAHQLRNMLRDTDRREEILRGVGDYHFGSRQDLDQRKATKALFNALDMDGTYGAWRLPVNLQHDGLLVQLWSGDDRGEVARSLERLSTAVLGYDQPVSSALETL